MVQKKELNQKEQRMKEIAGGEIASQGFAIGKVLLLSDNLPPLPEYTIMKGDIEREMERLRHAIALAQHDIRSIQESVDSDILQNIQYLDAHSLMMNDPVIQERVSENLSRKLLNIETVYRQTMDAVIDEFKKIESEYYRQRAEDLEDVQKSVLRKLLGHTRQDLRNLEEDVIVVAETLSPSQTAAMDKNHVIGIVSELGGRTSHTAILARALEIPAIVGMPDVTDYVLDGQSAILDANHGLLILDPTEDRLRHYTTAKHVFDRFLRKLGFLNELPAETLDSKRVFLNANIEIPEEVDGVKSHGADGVGLFRTEFIFPEKEQLLSEEKQLAVYRDVLERMEGKPVIIRTMDFGGDKFSYQHRKYKEANPFLGWRSIRFCLSQPEVFRTQLRAILRASQYGPLSIMLPMISGVEELQHAKEQYRIACDEVSAAGHDFRDDIKLGIMMEVPSAVLVADELAEMCDFFSIGTNDLIQYTIAVDRGNERIAYLYQALHPAVLRLIKMVIEAGQRHDLEVSMCGEMAGNPEYAVLLLGMGLTRLSMSSSAIPEVKRIIRSTEYSEAVDFAQRMLELHAAERIEREVKSYMEMHYPDIMQQLH